MCKARNDDSSDSKEINEFYHLLLWYSNNIFRINPIIINVDNLQYQKQKKISKNLIE